MAIQPAHTFHHASQAHAALMAAGKQVAELGARVTVALKASAATLDTYGPRGATPSFAHDLRTHAGALEQSLAGIAALVAMGDKYYAHVALHGGETAFIANMTETLPYLESTAAELERAIPFAEDQQRTAGVVAQVSHVVQAGDAVAATIDDVNANLARTIEHLASRAASTPEAPSRVDATAALRAANATSRADLERYSAQLVADRQRGRNTNPAAKG